MSFLQLEHINQERIFVPEVSELTQLDDSLFDRMDVFIGDRLAEADDIVRGLPHHLHEDYAEKLMYLMCDVAKERGRLLLASDPVYGVGEHEPFPVDVNRQFLAMLAAMKSCDRAELMMPETGFLDDDYICEVIGYTKDFSLTLKQQAIEVKRMTLHGMYAAPPIDQRSIKKELISVLYRPDAQMELSDDEFFKQNRSGLLEAISDLRELRQHQESGGEDGNGNKG